MKVVTLQQPFASLYAKGLKRIETRSWNTKFRGEILIHAASGKKKEFSDLYNSWKQPGEIMDNDYFKGVDFNDLPFGKIIGKVDIIGTVNTNDILQLKKENGPRFIIKIDNPIDGTVLPNEWFFSELEFEFGNYNPNRYGWLSDNAVEFRNPIPAKGQLSLWNYDLLEQYRLAKLNDDREALNFFAELNEILL
jgi:activating signal cointegrator 1